MFFSKKQPKIKYSGRVLAGMELLTLYLHFVALYLLLTKDAEPLPSGVDTFGWIFFYVGIILCIPFSKWVMKKAKEKDELSLQRDWEVYEALNS